MTYLRLLIPGILTSAVFAIIGVAIQWLASQLFGAVLLEALVIALILGILWRNTYGISKNQLPGLNFSAKEILELAIVLLGASVDLKVLAKTGLPLILLVAVAITLVIVLSAKIGQLLGLSRNTAILVGVGNGVCGNSAIAAVAPTIGAKPEEIASSIGFTAILSIFVVIALPFIQNLIPMNHAQYGIIAGMVVYAVPQVLAATFPVSAESVAVGSLVKLTRVLFLAPLVFFFSMRNRRDSAQKSLSIFAFLPWFLIGFFIFAALRTLGVLAEGHGQSLREVGRYLTIMSMGAIGLNVDLSALKTSGGPIIATATISLIFLLIISVIAALTIFAGGFPS